MKNIFFYYSLYIYSLVSKNLGRKNLMRKSCATFTKALPNILDLNTLTTSLTNKLKYERNVFFFWFFRLIIIQTSIRGRTFLSKLLKLCSKSFQTFTIHSETYDTKRTTRTRVNQNICNFFKFDYFYIPLSDLNSLLNFWSFKMLGLMIGHVVEEKFEVDFFYRKIDCFLWNVRHDISSLYNFFSRKLFSLLLFGSVRTWQDLRKTVLRQIKNSSLNDKTVFLWSKLTLLWNVRHGIMPICMKK